MVRSVASPLRTDACRILQQVLSQGGPTCATTLRRWAKEGRSYRGETFSLQEVEAAITAFEALRAEKPKQAPEADVEPPIQPTTAEKEQSEGSLGLRVTLKSKSWPSSHALEAAKEVVKSLGRCGEDLKVDTGVLRSLFESHTRGACWPDVFLVCGRVRVGAHKAVLASFSDVLQIKFHGAFSDASDKILKVTQSLDVIRAVVEFLYTGHCDVDIASLGELVVLADFWQSDILLEAASQSWYKLPIVHQFEVLSSLDEESLVPRAMVGALVDSLGQSFGHASQRFPHDHCWKLLRELHEWLARMPETAVARLRHWLSMEEDELPKTLERFFIQGIKAASLPSQEEELRQLLRKRNLKTWLPEAMQRRIVSQLSEGEKLFEESGQVAFWFTWACSGGLRCQVLLDVFRAAQQKELSMEGADLTSVGLQLQGLEKTVGMALAEESYHTEECSFWERSWESSEPVCQHAASGFGRGALRGRPLPPLTLPVAHAALLEALGKAEVYAVSVVGPEAVAGIYKRQGEKFVCQRDKETLELMCFDKKSRLRGPSIAGRVHVHRNCALGEDGMEEINKLTLVWKGLPADEHKKANGFWYIQNAKSDDLQPPLAILLSRSPPWTWHAPWWLGLPGPEQRFRSEPSLAVRLDSVSPSEEANLRKSLSTVERPEKLLEVTESLAAQKLLRRAEEAKAAEKVQCFRREEEQSDWQQAAAIFDATAAQLCQILQELQGADAALRRRLLTKKRRLESDEEFIAAVKRLE